MKRFEVAFNLLRYIFTEPDYIYRKLEYIFQIRLIDCEAFEQCPSILYISKKKSF